MNLTLWIVAGLLAVAYLIGGGGKPADLIARLAGACRLLGPRASLSA